MAKVTSKLQVTVPKALADRYRIRPGDEIAWEAAGEVIRVVPASRKQPARDAAQRLRLFDQATARQQARERGQLATPAAERGWTREELYERGRAR
jgi:bifunctional DNA-binding transcriptional regulator/antitoxin component of YhaV-PrlF toxin-antitoxin module